MRLFRVHFENGRTHCSCVAKRKLPIVKSDQTAQRLVGFALAFVMYSNFEFGDIVTVAYFINSVKYSEYKLFLAVYLLRERFIIMIF